MSTTDVLNRYLFDDMHARGELVQLSKTYQEILEGHNYPDGVKALLGELLTATCLLTATLKFEGEIAVQLQGDGPVGYMVINGNNEQVMRGIARVSESTSATTLADLVGKGTLIITIRPYKGEPYQGVIPLEKPSIAECLAQYYETSDQIPTSMWLYTDTENGLAGGAFVQLLPDSEDKEQQMADYEHLCQLTHTIKPEEIFTLEATELLHRLYHQHEVRIFDPQAVSYQCSCSTEKCLDTISQFNPTELKSIIEEQGAVSMTCEYCQTTYSFDEAQLFRHLNEIKH
jgi:molecular chaperone Hsp33